MKNYIEWNNGGSDAERNVKKNISNAWRWGDEGKRRKTRRDKGKVAIICLIQ